MFCSILCHYKDCYISANRIIILEIFYRLERLQTERFEHHISSLIRFMNEVPTVLSPLETSSFDYYQLSKKKVYAIPVTGHGGPYGCEKSRLPYFLDNQLTGGGEVVSLKRRSPLLPGRVLVFISVRG
jgi:hypothetical protein